jgi:hypothetical protein
MPVVCIMCALNVDNTSLILPVAQATVIVAPIFFREQIVRRVRRVIRSDEAPTENEDDEPSEDLGDDPSGVTGVEVPAPARDQ